MIIYAITSIDPTTSKAATQVIETIPIRKRFRNVWTEILSVDESDLSKVVIFQFLVEKDYE